MTEASAKTGRLTYAALSIFPVVAAGALGNLATIPNIPTWYAHLAKPAFTPPNAVFGPAWTLLYILMMVAIYRILSRATPGAEREKAIRVFFIQLFLNALWSFGFFAAHSPLLGLVIILPLEAMILVTIIRFWRLDKMAAACLVPYAAWVAFAICLNGGIWWLAR